MVSVNILHAVPPPYSVQLARRVTWQLMLTATGGRHVGGPLLNGNAQAGGGTAKALGAKTGSVDGIQQFFFPARRSTGPGWAHPAGAAGACLAQCGAVVEAAADADAQHDGWAGLAPACLTVSSTKSFTPCTPSAELGAW